MKRVCWIENEILFYFIGGREEEKDHILFVSLFGFTMETFEPLCSSFQWIIDRISEFLGKRSGKSITAIRLSKSKQGLSMVFPLLLKALKL